MPTSSGGMPSHLLPFSNARGLSLSGLVLLVLFLTIVTDSVFPFRLLDPAWQLRAGDALINGSPFALIGLGLLHLAAFVDQRDALLTKRRQLAANLAVAVALGYLLLAPLLGTALLRQQQAQGFEFNKRVRLATSQLQLLRQAVNNATSVSDLEQQLAALKGPSPKLDDADRSLPLPLVRSRVTALLDQATAQVTRAKAAAPSFKPTVLIPRIARTSVATLALAFGFAGLAISSGTQRSLLQELQEGLKQLRLRRQNSRSQRGISDRDYIRQLAKGKK